MKKIDILLLGLIFIVAIVLRFYNLTNIPVGFHEDEASIGYNSYSILQTGRDSSGHLHPLYISQFDDSVPSGYFYIDAPIIKLLGLTVFATRFPAALFGALTVLAVYFLCYTIVKDKKVSLFSAFLVAVSPWSIVFSRTSAETLLALFFYILGFACIFFGIQAKKNLFMVLGTINLILSFFIYHSPRVFVPLFFLLFIILLLTAKIKKSTLKQHLPLIISFLTVSLVSIILVFFVTGGTSRFKQVSIFNFPSTKLVLEEQIREDGTLGTNVLMTRAFHNKIVNYSQTFISNYMQFFTGDFLFIKGGLPQLLQVPNMGLLYFFELPFILIGLVGFAIKKDRVSKIPILWLLAAPVVAALTVDDSPNVRRVIALLPMLEIIAAYGVLLCFAKIKNIKWRVALSICLCMVFLYSFAYFLEQYFAIAKVHRPWYRNNGVGQMVTEVKKSYAQSDKIVITKSTGGIYLLVLFYMHYDPSIYQKEGSLADQSFKGFGKFVFAPYDCPSTNWPTITEEGKRLVFVDRGDCPLTRDVKIKKYTYILRGDGSKAFRIVYN